MHAFDILLAAGPGDIDWGLLVKRIFNPTPAFWSALGLTVSIAVFSQLLGIILGTISALMQRSRFKILQFFAGAYIYIVRGTPVIVLVFFIYYGANMIFGVDLFPESLNLGLFVIPGAVLAGIVGLGIAEGAYMSEIIRSGIASVDLGQFESAAAIGMTKRTAMRRIIFPQAARTIVPPLGNQFNGMIKMTSLLAFIGIYEIFLDAQVTYSNTFKPVEVFMAVAVWYIVVTTIWNLIQRMIERRLSRSEREPAEDRKRARAIEKQSKEVIW
ncbi:ABC transporter permease subunit [Leucobacter sp. gxy201]|uniref:amino acid ABC transporter permease n=1 Tax=Leucobacter sp. gxy201 TaxID=2957200 RepID=UPI003DA0BBE2